MSMIETRTPKIVDLVSEAVGGAFLLPEFQREYVWDRSKVIDLVDSISRGFPIGSLLIWQTSETIKTREFEASLGIARSEVASVPMYVLDGQQRLSVLCGCFAPGRNDKGSIWNIVFNVEKDLFEHIANFELATNRQIPSHWFGRTETAIDALDRVRSIDDPDRELFEARLREKIKMILNYEIPITYLRNTGLNDVAPIFERINGRGQELGLSDLLRAVLWDAERSFFGRIEEEINDVAEDIGFGRIDEDSILRICSAVAGMGFNIEAVNKLRELSQRELHKLLDRVVPAVLQAIDFLRSEFFVADRSFVPFNPQFMILSTVFALHPSRRASHTVALRRWYWRSTFSEHFSGWNTGDMARDLKAIRKFGEDAEQVKVSFNSNDAKTLGSTNFHLRAARARGYRLLLAANRPQDILSGAQVVFDDNASPDNRAEFHHAYPRSLIADHPGKNSIANIIAITRKTNRFISNKNPSSYIKICREKLAEDFQKVFESHFIGKQALQLLETNDFDGFIAARSRDIEKALLSTVSAS